MASNNLKLFTTLLFIVLPMISITDAGTIAPSSTAVHNAFASKLINVIDVNQIENNVIYSPASIQTCLALGFLGADGQTAEELRQGLFLGAGDKTTVARNYGDFIKSSFLRSQTNGPILTMANRIYVNDKLQLAPEFNKNAETFFKSKAEPVAFADAVNTVNNINNWVEEQTQHKIKNLLQKDAVNGDTSAVIVNAIYFKGLWKKQFSEYSTHKADFSSNNQHKVSVDMMFNDDHYNYADLPELDATAIELPYENSDISMMIILPKTTEGLKSLVNKLSTVDLNEISHQMKNEDVDLFLPKFKIEFDFDLKEPLIKLGISRLFSDNAELNGLFKTDVPQKISDVKHKAFLEVNEAGSEAAAATFMKIVPMSLNFNKKTFTANHPFFFAIRDEKANYFTGHVSKF